MNKPRRDKTLLAWHYTTGLKFLQIIECGFLTCAEACEAPPEKPVLWFSMNQYWEETANKGWEDIAGKITTLTMRETFERAGGLVRFGISPKRLLFGEALRTKARIRREMWQALVKEGLRQKAKPSEWGGVIESIPVEQLVIEVMERPDFKWIRVAAGNAVK